MKTTQTVGVAIIGAGNFARRQHLPNLSRMPEARLIAICDLDRQLADSLRDQYGVERAFTDYRDVLDDPTVDAVVIATRADMQAAVATDALNAGKHVYVEKPLAETPTACNAVARARTVSCKRLAVGFNKRFSPIYRTAKKVMDADGGPRNLHFRMADDAWRWSHGREPGALLKVDVCHFFDLLRWFTGAEIASVYCISARGDDDCLSIRTTNNSVASILFSGHGTMDMPKERMDAVCTRGGVSAEDFVELSTYGYPGFEPIYNFGGHAAPEGAFMHVFLNSALGLRGWKAIRRGIWESRNDVLDQSIKDDRFSNERRAFIEHNVPNFMRDQGWYTSVQDFLRSICNETETEHATVEDALAASIAAQAAEESRSTGAVVCIQH